MENENIALKDERNDARKMASFITDKRENSLMHQIIGIALISYMNGVRDAEHVIRSAQITT